jgi:hypothetical protein
MNKTKPEDTPVELYFSSIANESRRDDCRALATLMSKATKAPATMWGKSMVGFGTYHYVYDSGREGDTHVVGFASRASNISLYGLKDAPGAEALLSKLGPHKSGKGCIYIRSFKDVDAKVLAALVTLAARARKPKST